MIYGYARVSTQQQSIERQLRNILAYDSETKIYQEAFTGTKVEGRKELEKLLKIVRSGDTIIFDSVSRMSRNADEGIDLYFNLLNQEINLIFLKESYINTEVYGDKLRANQSIKSDDNDLDNTILQGVRNYLELLAKKQIRIAFEQSEKEVLDLRDRTKQGLQTVKNNGVILGRPEGKLVVTRKQVEMLEIIKKLLPNHKDTEIMQLTGIARNTYYKYKKIITEI